MMMAALHIHHHFRGAPIDYGALAAAAAASWAGLPGPGEPVLIAAGVIAARHHLDIVSVVVVAFLGAAAGGVAGWIAGLKAGRSVVTAPGPFRRLRVRTVERGEALFARMPVVGVLLTPSWIAGIHGVRARIYLPINTISAVAWAVGIGLGAYYAGPPVIDVVDDVGTGVGAAAGAVVVVAIVIGIIRHRRTQSQERELEVESGPGD
jgi:membrane protein DedA with SNARE-associated domain